MTRRSQVIIKDEEESSEPKIKEFGKDKDVEKSGDGKKKKNYTDSEEDQVQLQYTESSTNLAQ